MFKVVNENGKALEIELKRWDNGWTDMGDEEVIYQSFSYDKRLLEGTDGCAFVIADSDLDDWKKYVKDWARAEAEGFDDGIETESERREEAENRAAFINGKLVSTRPLSAYICVIGEREYKVHTRSAMVCADKYAAYGVDQVVTVKTTGGKTISQVRWTPEGGGKYYRCVVD